MLNIVYENLASRIKLVGLIAPLVLGFNTVGILLCAYVLLDVGSAITEKSGAVLIDQVREDYAEFEAIDEITRKSMEDINELDRGIGTSMSEPGVVAMTELVMTSEKNAQLFLRLLKVNVYNLAGQIPGTASWYEIYAPAIDATLERSRARQLELLKIIQHYQQHEA